MAQAALDRTPVQWMIEPFRRFVVIDGRSCRAEYWWFALLTFIVGTVAALIDYAIDNAGLIVGHNGYFAMIAAAVLTLPQLTVSVRRLHDVGHRGWWLLLPSLFAVPLGLALAQQIGGYGDIGGTGVNLTALLLAVAELGALALLLVWMLRRGTPGANRFGPDPLAGAAE